MQLREEQRTEIERIHSHFSMNVSDSDKEVWAQDLMKYDARIIRAAFDEYRNENKYKPRPENIARRARRLHDVKHTNKATVASAANKPLKYGRSHSEDIMKEMVDAMYDNTPNLIEIIRGCESVSEKYLVCATALGRQQPLSEFDKSFLRILEKKREHNEK